MAELRAAVAEADALLLATPEYNRGTSGVLKNAIDWLSRPALASVLRWKPVAIMGASSGRGGRGARSNRCAMRCSSRVRSSSSSPRSRFRSRGSASTQT